MPPLFSQPPQTQTILCKANPQVLKMFSPQMSLSHYLTRQGTGKVSFICLLNLHVSSFGDLNIRLTGAFFDGINMEMHVTNMLVVRACSYTPMQSQLSNPPNFKPASVAFTLPDTSRRYALRPSQSSRIELTCSPTNHSDSPLSLMPSSSSETSMQSLSSSAPIFQPNNTDVSFTLPDMSMRYRHCVISLAVQFTCF